LIVFPSVILIAHTLGNGKIISNRGGLSAEEHIVPNCQRIVDCFIPGMIFSLPGREKDGIFLSEGKEMARLLVCH